jgi:hypothetical protein
MKILNYKEKIKEVLTQTPPTRDCDYALYYFLMAKLGFNCDKLTAHDLLKGMSADAYPNMKSVERCRRIIENECPQLRGLSYAKRHTDAPKEVKQELGYIETEFNDPGMQP